MFIPRIRSVASALLVASCVVSGAVSCVAFSEQREASDPAPGALPEGSDAGARAGDAARDGGGALPAPVPSCTTDLNAALGRLRVPGVSAGIVKNGRLVCTAVAGVASIEEDRKVTPDTVFTWASVSKTVTAVTLMNLFDEGRFALDDDINRYLPFQVRVPSCLADPITFRQLLTHTSSIIEGESSGVYAGSYVQGDSPIALGDFLKKYLVPGEEHYDATRNFAAGCPGTISSYSNVGAGLLGYLAEEIAKAPFDQLAAARVFSPLGMNETSFRLKGLDLSHLAMPYERISATTFKPVGHLGFPTYPDGLLRTSVPQLSRFLLMFMQLGELDGARILTRATAEEMRRAQVPRLDDTQGLIWYEDQFEGRTRVIGHDGGDPGVSSNMYFDPADGAGVLLVANGEWTEYGAEEVMAQLFQEAKAY